MIDYIRRPLGSPSPLGLYSQASVGQGRETVAIAGQVGVNEEGDIVGERCELQARQALMNVGKALASLDLAWGDVLKFNTYVVGRDSIAGFMRAREEFFEEIYGDGRYPPNTLVVVSGLVEEGLLVEIEALAMRSSSPARGVD